MVNCFAHTDFVVGFLSTKTVNISAQVQRKQRHQGQLETMRSFGLLGPGLGCVMDLAPGDTFCEVFVTGLVTSSVIWLVTYQPVVNILLILMVNMNGYYMVNNLVGG